MNHKTMRVPVKKQNGLIVSSSKSGKGLKKLGFSSPRNGGHDKSKDKDSSPTILKKNSTKIPVETKNLGRVSRRVPKPVKPKHKPDLTFFPESEKYKLNLSDKRKRPLKESALVPKEQLTRENKELLVQAFAEKAKRSFRNFCIFMDKDFRTPKHLDDIIIPELQSLADGKNDRLMIFVPPRHGKSETVSRKFPAYYLGKSPDSEVILTSYSYNLAKGFSRKVRDLIMERKYAALFNTTVKKDQQAIDHWGITGKKGGLLASGVGGSITGEGSDLFIIDDPFKGIQEAESALQRERVWEWYTSVVLTRLHPGAKLVIVLTRWHRDDLAGRILSDTEEAKSWKVINLQALIETPEQAMSDPLRRKIGEALWSERYTADMLLKTKGRVGSKVWHSLYQGNPTDPEEQKFKREWFENNMYDGEHDLPCYKEIYGGIDTASSAKEKADNLSFVTAITDKSEKDPHIYIDDVFLGKLSNSGFAKLVCNKDKHMNGDAGYRLIHLENNNGGEFVAQRIREVGEEKGKVPNIETRHTTSDKAVRASEWQHLVEVGIIKWNRNNRQVMKLIEHLITFDGRGSDIDDDVDACGFAVKASQSGKGDSLFSVTPDWNPMDTIEVEQ